METQEQTTAPPGTSCTCQSFMSASIDKLASALAKAQGEMNFASKDATGGMRNRYATLQSVIEAIRTPLAKHGISFTQLNTAPRGNGIKLKTILLHESGQWLSSEIELAPDKMGGIHGIGSAMTYARRYALAAICGISQDDDDGELAMNESGARKVQQPAQQRKPQAPSKPALDFAGMVRVFERRGITGNTERMHDVSSFLGREIRAAAELTQEEINSYVEANEQNLKGSEQ